MHRSNFNMPFSLGLLLVGLGHVCWSVVVRAQATPQVPEDVVAALNKTVAYAQPAAKDLLPEGAFARMGDSRFLQEHYSTAIAVSADGKQLASAETDNIHVRDADSRAVVRRIATPGFTARGLTWSQDGRLLAGIKGSVHFMIWNVAKGERHWPGKLRASDLGSVADLRFVAQDRLLAIIFRDWRVELWDVERGTLAYTCVQDFQKRSALQALGPDHKYSWVTLSPRGTRMAWLAAPPAGKDGASAVFFYDTETGKLLKELKGLPAASRVDLPDEGQSLVLYPAGSDKVARLTPFDCPVVDVDSGRTRFKVTHRAVPAVYVEEPYIYVPEFIDLTKRAVTYGASLLTNDGVGLVRWDLKTGKELERWDHRLANAAVSADGRRLAGAYARHLILCDGDLAPLREQKSLWYYPSLSFRADGRLIIRDGAFKQLWDPGTKNVLETVPVYARPAGYYGESRSAGYVDRMTFVETKNGLLTVFDLAANAPVCVLAGLGAEYIKDKRCLHSISPDGSRVLVYGREKDGLRVFWFDADKGKELGQYFVPAEEIRGKNPGDWDARWYSQDGKVFGYLAPDSRLVLVDCATRKVRQIVESGFKPGEGQIYLWNYQSVLDDRFLLERWPDHKLHRYLLRDKDGRQFRRFTLDLGKYHAPFQFTYDARLIAVNVERKRLDVYETATGKLCRSIPFANGVSSFAFSPDGKTLATSHDDMTVMLWDFPRLLGR